MLPQPGAEALDRVALGPLLEQLLRDVEGVVVDGVALHAQRHALDQRRAAAVARLLDRALGLAVDGEHVGAVDDDALEAVGLGAVGDVLGRVLEVRRRRVGPLVVVADEHDREAADAGEVHALVRVAARGGALAEPAERDAALLADAERERAADRDRQHRRQVADHRDQAQPRVGHVDVAVPAARRAVRAAHELGEDPPRLDAADDVDAQVAVQRRADVVGAHRGGDPDGGTLVPAARVERAGDLALLVEDVAALLDPARDQHVAVDVEEVVAVEARLLHLWSASRPARLHARSPRGIELYPLDRCVTGYSDRRARPRTGSERSAARCSATGSPSASGAGRPALLRGLEAELPARARSAAARCAPAARRATRRSRRCSRSSARSAAGRCGRTSSSASRSAEESAEPAIADLGEADQRDEVVLARPRGCRASPGTGPCPRPGGSPGCRARSRSGRARRAASPRPCR